jgi:Uma2 family endonuclease
MSETLVASIIKEVRQPRRYSLEEYFKREEKALYKHEFHNGIIKAMSGGTFNHDRLSVVMSCELEFFVRLKNLNHFVNGSNLKIRIEDYDKILYPDALVISIEPEYYEDRDDTITNPLIIVEVLSDSTKNYDKTLKFEMYRSLPSFKEYVLVNQDRMKVSVFTKQKDATWILKDYIGEGAIAVLYALHECPLDLNKIYKGLKLKTISK